MSGDRKSPITGRPLRQAGQSLTEERERILEDKILPPLIVAIVCLCLAGLEWWRHLTASPPAPWIASGLALLAVVVSGIRVRRWRPYLKNLRQAVDGERVVAERLELLRESGYQVFHDLVGDGFNVDHVLVGPGGVYLIETKCWSKPARGEPTIDFDGEQLLAAGFEPDRDPVVQTRAQANWLRHVIGEVTGRRPFVRPVVLFPGWFIRQSAGSTRDLWVLEPKALPGFLQHEPARLSPEEVRLIGTSLSRYIRAGEQYRQSFPNRV